MQSRVRRAVCEQGVKSTPLLSNVGLRSEPADISPRADIYVDRACLTTIVEPKNGHRHFLDLKFILDDDSGHYEGPRVSPSGGMSGFRT